MQSLARSALRFSWAASLFGAERALGLLRPTRAVDRAALDTLTWTAEQQLGDVLQGAFRAGEALQDECLALALGSLDPAQWQRSKARLTRHWADTLRFADPTEEGAACRRELSHKLEVFKLVRGVADELGLPPRGVPFGLARWVAIALRQPPRRALWLIEGLTHNFVETRLLGEQSPRRGAPDLLAEAELDRLPENLLPIVHAGLGLGIAEHVLAELRPGSSPAAFDAALERFEALCQSSSREAHLDAALEALGLVARCFYTDLVDDCDRALAQRSGGRLRQIFWHGVGRAVYFVPVSFVPGYGSLGQALAMAADEAPTSGLAEEAIAGVGYAFTLVNLSSPRVLEEALVRHGDELIAGAFHQGLVAAVVMRQRITPEDPELECVLDHRPTEARRAELWHRAIGEPCRRALDERAPLAGRYAALAGEQR